VKVSAGKRADALAGRVDQTKASVTMR
jgi:hypothetical protein